MLRGFFLSGAVRGYALVAGFAVQLLLSSVTSKDAFGQINTFISTVLLLTFLVASAPTRQLVRELGAFGLAERGRLAEDFIGNAHLWIILSAAVAFVAALVGQTYFALIVATVGVTFPAAIYSAYFRGIGRYVIGNIEAGVIRATILTAIFAIAMLFGLELAVTTAEMSYLAAVAIGLLLLVLARDSWPSIKFSHRILWPYGTLPLTLTILAGLEIFVLHFDIIVSTYLYGANVTAEVRVAQQLRTLTMLPLQVYLMFAFDRLSRTLRTGVETTERRREIALIRILLVVTFIAAIALSGPFVALFFEGGTDFLTTLGVLSGVVPMVLCGPKAELVISAAREGDHKVKTMVFLLAYVLLVPFLCWAFDLPPWSYFFGQATISALFFASLPKVI
jgi:O-antigen/teichoic acid export membrane protein